MCYFEHSLSGRKIDDATGMQIFSMYQTITGVFLAKNVAESIENDDLNIVPINDYNEFKELLQSFGVEFVDEMDDEEEQQLRMVAESISNFENRLNKVIL